MRRPDNDGSASRGYPDQPRLDRLLPDIVLENAPAAVVEAAQTAREKVSRWQLAQAVAMEARQAAEQAPADDRAAERQAFDAGRKLPAPTAEKRQQEPDAAQRTLALAQRAAREAIDEQDRVVEAHKAEVVDTFQNTLAARHERMLGLVDHLAGEAAGFDAEARIIDAIHFGSAFPKPHRRGRLAREVDQVAAAISERFADAVPRPLCILEHIGSSPVEWNQIAAKLGINQIDAHWCAARDQLVADGQLSWTDANGVQLTSFHRLDGITRYLARHDGPPPETRIDKARRERRERQAQQSAA